jgi:hypothetical protein
METSKSGIKTGTFREYCCQTNCLQSEEQMQVSSKGFLHSSCSRNSDRHNWLDVFSSELDLP